MKAWHPIIILRRDDTRESTRSPERPWEWRCRYLYDNTTKPPKKMKTGICSLPQNKKTKSIIIKIIAIPFLISCTKYQTAQLVYSHCCMLLRSLVSKTYGKLIHILSSLMRTVVLNVNVIVIVIVMLTIKYPSANKSTYDHIFCCISIDACEHHRKQQY